MDFISTRVNILAQSQTLAMSQKSNELKAQGIDVINLSVGEPDFNTPDHIKEAAKRAIDDNFSFYSPVPGYMSLRKAVSEKLLRENGVSFRPEQIVVSGGAKQALCNVILATVNPGDEVIIPTPAWEVTSRSLRRSSRRPSLHAHACCFSALRQIRPARSIQKKNWRPLSMCCRGILTSLSLPTRSTSISAIRDHSPRWPRSRP